MAHYINSACESRFTLPEVTLCGNFCIEQFRVATFCKYPLIAAISALVFAANGFVYVGTGSDGDDSVLCYFCGKGKKSWLENEDVQNTHRQLSPSCPMVTGVNCTNIELASNVRADCSFDRLVDLLLKQCGKENSGIGLRTEFGQELGQFQSEPRAKHENRTQSPNPKDIAINLQQTPPTSNTYSARSTYTLTPSPVIKCPVSLEQSATSAAQPIQIQACMCDNPQGGVLEPSTENSTGAADVSRNETLVTLARSSSQQDQESWRFVNTGNEQHVILRDSLLDIEIERPTTTTDNAESSRETTGHRYTVAERSSRPTTMHASDARQREESRARRSTTHRNSIGDAVIPRVEFEHSPTTHSGKLDLLNIPEVATMAGIIPQDKLLTAASQLNERGKQMTSKNILTYANRLC